jgi:acetyl-CoA carboxylase biotin carboxylase subunit
VFGHPGGPAAVAESYLNADIMLHVANARGCDAVHPGYGFLAENAEFAARCAEQGLTFVGPSADSIALMGDKAAARAKVQSLGAPVVPGSEGTYVDAGEAAAAAAEIGFPLLLKARFGGGGRGMRIAIDAD